MERSTTSQKLATQLVRLLRRSGPPAPPRSLRGWRPPRARVGAPVQESLSESPPCAARQDGAPPPQPRGLHLVLQQKWHRLCLRLRKASEEMGRLIGPPTPVSAANTTRRARPPSPTNSGYVVSFLRRASSRATPGRLAPPLLGLPSRRRGDTNVVSRAR